MNYDKYIDLISEERYEEATLYKSSCIPDVLYKYCWLDDNEEKNGQRLSTLANGQIYLSPLNQFNDPFEGKAFIFNEDTPRPKGWTIETFRDFVKQINNHARICCFTNADEKQQNMPMWAYYANNHRGFCVAYKISPEHKRFIFPVSYDPCRVDGTAFICNLILGIIQMIQEGKDTSQMPGEVSAYNHLAYLSLTYKHASWKHEKEFRALVPIDCGMHFPLAPYKIYIGMNCSKEHEARLIEIAKGFEECEVIKMQEPTNSSSFDLNEISLFHNREHSK